MTNLKANLKVILVTERDFHTTPEYREEVRIVGFVLGEHGPHAIFVDGGGQLCSAPISEFDAVEIDQ